MAIKRCIPMLLVGLLLSSVSLLPAQTVQWATKAEGRSDGGVFTSSPVIAPDGSYYVTGQFNGMPTLGYGEAQQTTLVTSPDYDGIFVAKYNADGTLAWARQPKGTVVGSGASIAILAEGSILVIGNYGGTAVFGQGEPAQTTLNSAGGYDIFVAKYSAKGTLVWAKQAGGEYYYESGSAIVGLADGSCLVAGNFSLTAVFGQGEPAQTKLTAVGSTDIFLAKYNANGTLAWAKKIGGTGADHSNAIAKLADGTILLAGNFSGAVVLGQGEPIQTTLTSAGDNDIFLAKFNTNGALVWAKRAGGTSYETPSSIAAQSDGSFLAAGYFYGSIIFGQGEPAQTKLTAVGSTDVFFAKFNANGTLAWAKGAGGTERADGYTAITSQADGSMLVTGCFTGKAVLGAGEPGQTTLTSAGNSDIFLAKYNSNGTLAWARRAGGPNPDYGSGPATLADGTILMTGEFTSMADFGMEGANPINLSVGMITTSFHAKYRSDGSFIQTRTIGGRDLIESVSAKSGPNGSILVSGMFAGSIVLGQGEPNPVTLTEAGGEDLFLAKYDDRGKLAWAKRAGGTSIDSPISIAVLADGSILMTGEFNILGDANGTAVFGQGESNQATLISAGTSDIFVARYNADGTLAWAKRAGGTGEDFPVYIAATSDGSILLAGYFTSTAVFGQGQSSQTTLTSAGDRDLFLAKYNANGTLVWAKRAGGTNLDELFTVVSSTDGSMLMTGDFQGNSSFGQGEPAQTILNSAGSKDIFLTKYNANGTLAWAKRAGGKGVEYGSSLVRLADGSILITGGFSDTAVFGQGEPAQTTLTATGSGSDIFLAKYSANGTLVWARRAGGTDQDDVYTMATFPNGSILMTGCFKGTSIFGPGEPGQTTLYANGYNALFLARYNANGMLVWARQAGGNGTSSISPYSAWTLADNSIVMNGNFWNTVVFGKGESEQTSLTSAGSSDLFIAKYNANGTLAWARRAGGMDGDYSSAIATLADESILVTGVFGNNFTIFPKAGEVSPWVVSESSTAVRNMFLFKLGPMKNAARNWSIYH